MNRLYAAFIYSFAFPIAILPSDRFNLILVYSSTGGGGLNTETAIIIINLKAPRGDDAGR